QSVAVQAGTTQNVNFNLQPLTGNVSITSNAANTSINVDGSVVGNAPLTITRNGGTTVTITASAPGFQSQTQSVAVQAGTTQNVNFNLQPLPGQLNISSNPAGARVFIDGQDVGTTPSGSALSFSVPAGNYNILFQLAGFQDQTIQVTVAPGATENVSANLVPATGFIQISSNVAGARVFVNGFLKGVTDANGMLTVQANIGAKEVVVIAEGFRAVIGNVTVLPGATIQVQATLQPAP
ncbi:MAG: PEGA domain-containing protein, partial [Deinococcus sp.]|nr:PEGA domain-containing protein [Deinococcus sp.]